jgi:Family of unknown function (DUF6011)
MAYATEKQLNFVKSLLSQKDILNNNTLPPAQRDFLGACENRPETFARLAGLDTKRVSNIIQALLDCPDKPKQAPTPVEVATNVATTTTATSEQPVPEPGYFFIVDPTDDVEKFFRVNKGRAGTRWENYTFLSVQASDYFYPIKSHTHRDAVYAEILKDPVNAMNEYGIRLGRCGVCNRTLTDRDSRLRGIGPICAARLDFNEAQADESEINLLTSLGLITDNDNNEEN